MSRGWTICIVRVLFQALMRYPSLSCFLDVNAVLEWVWVSTAERLGQDSPATGPGRAQVSCRCSCHPSELKPAMSRRKTVPLHQTKVQMPTGRYRSWGSRSLTASSHLPTILKSPGRTSPGDGARRKRSKNTGVTT